MTVRWRFPVLWTQPQALVGRLLNSTVAWSWAYNALRLATGVVLLPLLLNLLPVAELGMYYVLLAQIALVPLIDFGFGTTIGRFVSYAMGGADSLQAQGVAKPSASTLPNYALLWQLLFTTRKLYRLLTLAALVVLALWGTYNVELRIGETASPTLTRVAWALTLVSALSDIYWNWWNVFLRSMDQVLVAMRYGLVGTLVRLLVTAGLLLCGAGLISLPVGTFSGSLLMRFLARRRCLQLLACHPRPSEVGLKEHLAVLWPNTWRLGIQFLSGYLTVSANTTICTHAFGLSANAQYGLSVQLLDIIAGMAYVWTSVKWPIVGQYLAKHEPAAVQRVLWPRVWLQTVTFLLMAGTLLVCGPFLLSHFGGGKRILPLIWMVCLASNSFFQLQLTLWATLITMGNRLPMLWPTVATNVASLTLSLTLVRFTGLGLGGLVLGPLLAGCLFNYWYWPGYAARGLGTTLLGFLFSFRPRAR